MNLGSDLISLSATGSLFHNIGPLNFSVCCIDNAVIIFKVGSDLFNKSQMLCEKVFNEVQLPQQKHNPG